MRDPPDHFAFHPRSLKAIPLLSIEPQEGKEGRRVRHLSRWPQTFSADLWVIERQRRPSSATSVSRSSIERSPKPKIANGEKFIRARRLARNKGLLIVPLDSPREWAGGRRGKELLRKPIRRLALSLEFTRHCAVIREK